MLRKLLKYELRSVYQTMLPLYGAVLIIGLINAIFSGDRIPDDTVRNISGIVYIALLIAMATLCLVIAVQRFYNGLLSEEGYLMFTLPVKPWQHIASKVLSASLMIVTGVIVTVITLVLIFIGTGIDLNDFAAEISYVFGAAFQQYSYPAVLHLAVKRTAQSLFRNVRRPSVQQAQTGFLLPFLRTDRRRDLSLLESAFSAIAFCRAR